MSRARQRKRAARVMARAGRAFGFVATLAASPWASAQVAEYDVKAAFVFNFAVFTAPAAPAAAGDFAVCIFGRDPFGASTNAPPTRQARSLPPPRSQRQPARVR